MGIEGLGIEVLNADGNPVLSGSIDIGSVDLTLDGYLKIYHDGTIEANCAGTFAVNNLDIGIDQWKDANGDGIIDEGEITYVDLSITNIDIAFGGEIIIQPGDEKTGKPPVIDLDGYVDWDVDGDIAVSYTHLRAHET